MQPTNTAVFLTRWPRILSLCLLLLTIVCTLTGCRDDERKAAKEAPTPVMATLPTQENIPLTLESTGTTQAVRSADMVARVEGVLLKVAYEDGALVHEGEPLFVIDPTMYKAKAQQAQAALAAQKTVRNRAAIEYARNQKLYQERAASQSTLESWREQLGNAEAQVVAAEAAVAQADVELGYTIIKAPFTGRVTRHKADVGSTVGPQSGALATIISQDPVYAQFSAPAESVLPLLSSFDAATSIPLELSVGDGGFTVQGTVDYMAPQVEASSGTLAMRGIFPNRDGTLLPGLFVRVRVVTGQNKNALVIPRQAVFESQGKSFVYSIDGEGKAHMLPVTPGQTLGTDKITIQKGLTPDMLIIYDGMAKLRPGQTVVNQAPNN